MVPLASRDTLDRPSKLHLEPSVLEAAGWSEAMGEQLGECACKPHIVIHLHCG